MPDPSTIGQDKTYKDATEAYDAEKGGYKDTIETVSTEQRLPQQQLPQAPDPSPFKLGAMTPGERGGG